MKYYVIILMTISIILISGCNQQEEEVIKIGIILPLSGSAAYYGGIAQQGADLALEKISEEFPNLNFELVYEDSEFLATKAVSAYQRLRTVENVDAVITGASHISLAVKPLAEEDGILQGAIFSAADSYSSPNDLSFRTNPRSDVDSVLVAEYVEEQGFEKASILYLQNDFGLSYRDALKKDITSAEIIGEEEFILTEKDFRSILTKVKEEDPDLIMMIGLAIHYGLIMQQAEELGIDSQFLGMWAAEDPVLLSTAGEAANGLVYMYPFDSTSVNPETVDFVGAFNDKYERDPDAYASQSYEALRLIGFLFSECGKDYDCIQNNLLNLEDYNSVFGDFSLDENGDVSYEFVIKTVKDGKFVVLE